MPRAPARSRSAVRGPLSLPGTRKPRTCAGASVCGAARERAPRLRSDSGEHLVDPGPARAARWPPRQRHRSRQRLGERAAAAAVFVLVRNQQDREPRRTRVPVFRATATSGRCWRARSAGFGSPVRSARCVETSSLENARRSMHRVFARLPRPHRRQGRRVDSGPDFGSAHERSDRRAFEQALFARPGSRDGTRERSGASRCDRPCRSAVPDASGSRAVPG
jgi:hypothetical protein